MSWRDNLRPASFKGVEFHYEEVRRSLGRRVKRHEYPGGDQPYHEDLGAVTSDISITAYVLEPDHLEKAQRLADALNEPGAGKLVHPYHGELSVVAISVQETFTTSRGGMAQFQLRFERAGPNRNPSARIDTPSLLATNAAAIETTAVSDFALSFSVDGAPGWVDETAQSDVITTADGIGSQINSVVETAEAAADFAHQLVEMKSTVASLVRSPQTLAARVASAIRSTPGVSPALQIAASSFDLGTIAATTPSRLLQSSNRKAIIGLVNQLGTSAAIRNLPLASIETSDDAYGIRDSLITRIDALSVTASDDMVRSLSNAASAVTRHVSAIAPALPRVVQINPTMTRPSIVHAYQLFGDKVETVIDNANEIASRNGLRHPDLSAPGTKLEVLSNV